MLNLNSYQTECADFLRAQRKGCGLLPPRAGKTRIAIAAATSPLVSRVLILAPSSALFGWRREINAYYGADITQLIRGPAAARQAIWKEAQKKLYGIYLTTYESYARDYMLGAAIYWNSIILDEVHRISNRKTIRFKRVKQLRSDYLFNMTGTSKVIRGPQDLWTMLYLCDRKRFSSYWKFVDAYCNVFDGPFGKVVEGARNVAQLRQMLKEYMYYRTRAEIWPDMPIKTRMTLPTIMTPKQAKLYYALAKDMVAKLSSGESDYIVVANVLTQMTRLRQILVTPKLIDPSINEYGGGLEAIADQLADLDDEQVVICTPFPAAIPYIMDRLSGIKGREFAIFRGGITLKEHEEAENKFNASPCIALCSIRYAQGYSLSAAANSFFLGYDWDPDENYQAEDRLYSFDVTTPRQIIYITHENTVDYRVLEVLNEKTNNFNQVFGSRRSLYNLLRTS